MTSRRDKIMQRANTFGLLMTIVVCILIFYFVNNNQQFIAFIVIVLFFAIFLPFILWTNKRIYKAGTSLPLRNTADNGYEFTIDKTYKQLVVDIVWEMWSKPFRRNEVSCSVTIVDPNNNTIQEQILASNTEFNTKKKMFWSIELSLYNREGYQKIINNPTTGTYSMTLKVPSTESGFRIKKINATVWGE